MLVMQESVRPRGKLLLLPLLLLILGCSTAKKDLPREAASAETASVGAAPTEAESVGGGGETETAASAAGTEPGAEAADPAARTGPEAPNPAAGPETAGGADPAVPGEAPLAAVLIPEELRPGEPFAVAFSAAGGKAAGDRAAGNYRAVLQSSRGERIAAAAFFSLDKDTPEVWAALLAVPSTAPPGAALVRLERNGTSLGEIPLRVAGREFVSEEIALDQRNTDIRTAPDPQKTAESEQLAAIIYSMGTEILATGPFVPPVNSTRRTSFYGDRRVFRYVSGLSDTAIHAGVDYGVPTGTEVRSCAAGKVALARFRISTGNSVVLEHLPGVYSLYYHLDSIQVAQGDRVNAGDILGKSGSTGLATGPHLHWEIRVAGENADPDAFVARAVLDKETILSKLGK
jgi:murein DD-endopeptidase MepM/ murein hydrolase activator NlpD